RRLLRRYRRGASVLSSFLLSRLAARSEPLGPDGRWGMSLPDQLRGHRFNEPRWAADVDTRTVVRHPSRHCKIPTADPTRPPGDLRRDGPSVDQIDLQPVKV